MDRLMEKLALSKAIMDKADGIKSSNSMNGGLPPTSLQQFKNCFPEEYVKKNSSLFSLKSLIPTSSFSISPVAYGK